MAQSRALRAKMALKARPEPKLHLPANTVCTVCGHPRSSHNPLMVTGSCRAADCRCVSFAPECDCTHSYENHRWGAEARSLACALCRCEAFTASTADTQLPLF